MSVHPWPGPGWDPLGDLDLITQEMTRLFEQLVGQGKPAEGTWTPPVDVSETAQEVRVQVELPGVSERSIRVEYAEGMLTIRADRPPDPALRRDQVQQLECRYGAFMRRLPFPFSVDRDRIGARYQGGVLEIRLPKRATATPREVPIEAA